MQVGTFLKRSIYSEAIQEYFLLKQTHSFISKTKNDVSSKNTSSLLRSADGTRHRHDAYNDGGTTLFGLRWKAKSLQKTGGRVRLV